VVLFPQNSLRGARGWTTTKRSSRVFLGSTGPPWGLSSATCTGELPPRSSGTSCSSPCSITGFASRVQKCADLNQMCTKNLSLLFAPSLFQTDGKGVHEVKIVEDLIDNYLEVFDVSTAPRLRLLCED